MIDVNEQGNGKRLGVYAVIERPDRDGKARSFWNRIGSAFVNQDGSLNLFLDAFPIGTNKIQVREVREEPRAGANGAARRADAREARS